MLVVTRAVVLIAFALDLGPLAHAAPVTYYFGGQVRTVDAILQPTISVGDAFAGSFTFDSAAIDDSPFDPHHGLYLPKPEFSATLRSMNFFAPSTNISGSIVVLNDAGTPFPVDSFLAGNTDDDGSRSSSVNGLHFSGISVSLWDLTASTFASDSLPVSGLNLGSFSDGYKFFVLTFRGSNSQAIYRSIGDLNYISLTPIPEPENFAMLLAGLGLLAFAVTGRGESGQVGSGSLMESQ